MDERADPEAPATPLAQFVTPTCSTAPTSSPLSLLDAIQRALCESPRTRASWADTAAAVASLKVSKSAYLPSLSAAAKYIYQSLKTDVANDPELQSRFDGGVNEEALSLSWVLYDFGARASTVENSSSLLLAAKATQDLTLQDVFASVAKDYFAAQAAQARVAAMRTVEADAHSTLEAAAARVDKGVAPITDQLQADTAAAQALYERARAEGDMRTAIGVLALDLDLPPVQEIALPAPNTGVTPDSGFVKGINELLELASRTNPAVLKAVAQWQAALSNVHFARSQGMPNISLIGEDDRSNQPVSASLGQPSLPALTRDGYIGIQIAIPLLDSYQRHYQIHAAEAHAQVLEQDLRETERKVATQVWESIQTLQTSTDNIQNTLSVRDFAGVAYEAAQHRYRSGVGNIIELLNAQSTLASSQQQWIQAQLDWRIARVQLAASLGNLGMWIVEN